MPVCLHATTGRNTGAEQGLNPIILNNIFRGMIIFMTGNGPSC
jgi:hypothetical protein